MATKTLTIREDVYDRLKSMKREEESFSDLLERLSGGDEDVMKGFGVFAGEEGDEFAASVEEARERMDRDYRERADDIFGQ
ncbi:antitoxin VapB family protein [Halorussus halobius]|uniref:antitoxin VapB family protein n=1 Tax=Halorussus halobius TaxID=1710537 RepID=UPI00109218A4|nr:antitoxin VapB family protein [Halorussus halobius]